MAAACGIKIGMTGREAVELMLRASAQQKKPGA
jgi:hypothetical protein